MKTRPAIGNSPAFSFLKAAAFFAIYVLWGGTFLARQIALRSVPPFLESSFRFLAAAAVLMPVAWLRKEPFPTPREIFHQGVVGLFLLLGGTGVVSWSQKMVPSGIASLFVASVPMWMVLVDWLWGPSPAPGRRVLGGLAAGFAGIVLLVNPSGGGGFNPLGGLTLLLASLSWAIGSVYAKRHAPPRSDLYAVSLQMSAGGFSLILAAYAAGQMEGFSPASVLPESRLALVYLVFCGSIAGFTAYQWLLRVTRPAVVATHAYVNPLIAVILGWVLLGEPLTGRVIASGILILLSVALIITGSPEARSQDREPLEIP